ncbi:MAG: glycerate kinase [Nitrososphaerota archaeon]|nr:glycerate kinase [Nitrososphaerota archaeon]MDG7024108.1 glycerate kinase [Nitrososphaerota archaeon]
MISSDLAKAISRANGARRDALLAVRASLEASDPRLMVRRSLGVEGSVVTVGNCRLDLDAFSRLVVVGGGKASGLMASEIERILGERISDGVVVVPESQSFLPRLRKVRFARSTHPIPTERGVKATREMLRVLDGTGTGSLVVCLISGGGSALMPLPVEGVSVQELGETTDLLLKAGAKIGEINCVRKHLSQVAGGRLVERTRGAKVISFVVSDVVGDDLSTIASGPTVPDPTTFLRAMRILERHRVWNRIPAAIRRVVRSGVDGGRAETPKPGSRAFARVSNVVVGSNSDACAAAAASLRRSGYRVHPFLGGITGEARVVGRRLARSAWEGRGRKKWAAVWGGETAVTVRGRGVGGRNQEVVLAAAIGLQGARDAVVVSFGTDGVDGPTDAAGAVADSSTCWRAKSRGLDPESYLENNDSYTFFKKLGDLVVTGPTGTNVTDVMMALSGG